MPYTPESLLSSPRPPLGEAHGGYTFCALASWVLLQPVLDLSPRERPQINTKSLLRWLVQMQGSPAEIGGFRGRANKLVDGCYSWWVGGAFGLLEALGVSAAVGPVSPGGGEGVEMSGEEGEGREDGKHGEDEHEWDDVNGPPFLPSTILADLAHKIDVADSFFNREALQEYILFAGQHPTGGLRDKPPKQASPFSGISIV